MAGAENRTRRTYNLDNAQGTFVAASPGTSSHTSNSMIPANPRSLSPNLSSPPFTSTMANPWVASPDPEEVLQSSSPATSGNTAYITTPFSSSPPSDFSQTTTLRTDVSMNMNTNLGTKLRGLRNQTSPALQGLLHRYKELKDDAENSNKSYQQVLDAAKQKLGVLTEQVQNMEQLYLAAREKVRAYEDLPAKLTFESSDVDMVQCLDIPGLSSMVDEAYNCQEAVKFMLRTNVSIEDLRRTMDAHLEAGRKAEASKLEQEKLVATLEKEAQEETETQGEIIADLECLSGLAERWEK